MRDVRSGLRVLVYALVLAAALASPGASWAQEVGEVLARGDYSATDKQRVRAVFDRAEAADVPTDMLIPRLAEGIAKAVPAARLVPVLEARLESLVIAREVLEEYRIDPSATGRSGVWNAAALLIWDDAPREHLERIVAAAGREAHSDAFVDEGRLRPGFSLYASLVDWGLRRNEALAVSEATVASSLQREDFPAVVAILTSARQERIPISRAVDRLTSQLPHASEVSDLRDAVLY